MIIRVLRGRVGPDRVASFHDMARSALADACPDHGCAWARMGRQVHSDRGEEILLVTVWSSMDALYDWIGGADLVGVPMRGGGGDAFDYFDVQHYETYERAGGVEFQGPPELSLQPGV